MAIQNWSERVVLITPPLDPGFTEDLSEVLAYIQHGQAVSIVLDLKDAQYLSSSNLSLLLRLRKTVLEQGNRMILCNVGTRVWSIFLVTGLDAIFSFSDDVTTALATVSVDLEGN